MMDSAYCMGEDYVDKFDPSRYLQRYQNCGDRSNHMLRCFYDAFKELPDSLKVLDYGSGPSLLPAMTAATKASEIIMCDYSPKNREVLRQWLQGSCASFDWTSHFEYIVRKLEGNFEDDAVQKRQDLFRKAVKAVVHCDLTQDPLIEKGYDQLYDAVSSSLVIDTVPRTYDEFVQLLTRLGRLVKKGGTILLYFVENAPFYDVGDFVFHSFPVTTHSAENAVSAAGFRDIKISNKFSSISTGYTYFFLQGIHL